MRAGTRGAELYDRDGSIVRTDSCLFEAARPDSLGQERLNGID